MRKDSEGSYLLEQAMFDDYCAQQLEPWPEQFIPTSWTTNDGRTVLIKNMTDDHLKNCIKWIKLNRFGHMSNVMSKAMADELKRRP